MHTELTDPNFWTEVEGADLITEIKRLEAIEKRTKKENYLLRIAKIQFASLMDEAKRLAELNKKWQSGSGVCRLDDRVSLEGEEWADDLFPPDEKDPNKVYCSFCKRETSLAAGTKGKGKLRFREVTEIIDDEHFETKVTASQSSVIACPDCILELKPKTDKHGKITQQAFEQASEV